MGVLIFFQSWFMQETGLSTWRLLDAHKAYHTISNHITPYWSTEGNSQMLNKWQYLRSPTRWRFRHCLFVCPLATFSKNFGTDLHEIFRKGWQWASEQRITFLRRSGTNLPDGGTDIATLVRRSLEGVCTVPVLLSLVMEMVQEWDMFKSDYK